MLARSIWKHVPFNLIRKFYFLRKKKSQHRNLKNFVSIKRPQNHIFRRLLGQKPMKVIFFSRIRVSCLKTHMLKKFHDFWSLFFQNKCLTPKIPRVTPLKSTFINYFVKAPYAPFGRPFLLQLRIVYHFHQQNTGSYIMSTDRLF